MHVNWCQQYPRLCLNSQFYLFAKKTLLQAHLCKHMVAILVSLPWQKRFQTNCSCQFFCVVLGIKWQWCLTCTERFALKSRIFTRRRNDRDLHDKLVVFPAILTCRASWPVTLWHVTSGTCGSAVDLPACLRPPLRCDLKCTSPWNLLGGSGSLPEFALRNGCGSAITSAM